MLVFQQKFLLFFNKFSNNIIHIQEKNMNNMIWSSQLSLLHWVLKSARATSTRTSPCLAGPACVASPAPASPPAACAGWPPLLPRLPQRARPPVATPTVPPTASVGLPHAPALHPATRAGSLPLLPPPLPLHALVREGHYSLLPLSFLFFVHLIGFPERRFKLMANDAFDTARRW